ncbi:MAG TPA: choice-of-anchor tandem repeat GloVer-containing protein [Pirellulales bacterium]|jgi:uncharacterized repeat protein (TIGR03803 family)|nr:choice-of-anchor tandem repeat GloVer-containing protein [Pirellulales bacterium]
MRGLSGCGSVRSRRKKQPAARKPTPAIRLGLERLEDRRMLSGVATQLSSVSGVQLADPIGDLTLVGSTLYGETGQGIFSVKTDGSGYQVLHGFSDDEGSYPVGGLTLVGSTLYGVTSDGGAFDDGTLFSLQTDGTNFRVLHSFMGDVASDGANPAGRLTAVGSLLVGVTSYGGENNSGIIFSINDDGTGYDILSSFYEYEEANGNLVAIGSTLYGTTDDGFYSINADGSDFEWRADFYGEADPIGGLVLVGTTFYGLADGPNYDGSVLLYSVNEDGSGFQVLTSLPTAGSGFYDGELTAVGQSLVGVFSDPYESGTGLMFSVQTNGSNYQVLQSFSATGGSAAYPEAGFAVSGTTIYGVTAGPYFGSDGNVFAVNADGTNYHSIVSFPTASGIDYLTPGGSGSYGISFGGKYGDGALISMDADGGDYSVLYAFSDPAFEHIESLSVSGSTIVGVTSTGGVYGYGMIFSIGTDGSNFTIRHSFAGDTAGDGADPIGGLALLGSTLYGVTTGGGNASYYTYNNQTGLYDLVYENAGTIYSVNADGSGYQAVHSFTPLAFGYYYDSYDDPPVPTGDGADPSGGLILVGSTLYGSTSSGGDGGAGTIFSIGAGGGLGLVASFTYDSEITNAIYGYSSPVLTGGGGSRLYGTVNGSTNFSIDTGGGGFSTLQQRFTSIVTANSTVYAMLGTELVTLAADGGSYTPVFDLGVNGITSLLSSGSSLYGLGGGALYAISPSSTNIDDGALELSGTFTYNSSTGYYTSSGPVQIGLIPQGCETFTPLLEVDNGTVALEGAYIVANGSIVSLASGKQVATGSFKLGVHSATTSSLSVTPAMTIAGLTTTFTSFSFVAGADGASADSYVALTGTFTLPSLLGGIVITVDTSGLFILGTAGVGLDTGDIELPDIDFEIDDLLQVSAEDMSFDYKSYNEELTIHGDFTIQMKDGLDTISLNVDLAGDNYIDYEAGRDPALEVVGSLTYKPQYSDFLFDHWFSIESVSIEIDTVKGDISGKFSLLADGTPVDGEIGFKDGHLDSIGITAGNLSIGGGLGIALEPPGLFIEQIGGTIDHLAPDDPDDLSLTGTIGVSWAGDIWATFTATVEIDTKNGHIDDINGKASVLVGPDPDNPIASGSATFDANFVTGVFGLTSVTFVGFKGHLTFDGELIASSNGALAGYGTGTFTAGGLWGLGHITASATIVASISSDNDPADSYFAASFTYTGFLKTRTIGAKITLAGNVTLVDVSGIDTTLLNQLTHPAVSINVDASKKTVVLAASWTVGSGGDIALPSMAAQADDDSTVPFQLIAPDGTIYTNADLGDGIVDLVPELSGADSMTLAVNTLQSGTWQFVLLDDSLDSPQFYAYAPLDQGAVTITSPTTAVSGGKVVVDYQAIDANPGAQVALFYDRQGNGFQGTPIASGLAAGIGSYTWDTNGLPVGVYHIYAVLTDDDASAVLTYATGTISVGQPYQVLYAFTDSDGGGSTSDLTAIGSTVYGTTGKELYSMNADGTDFQVISSFNGDVSLSGSVLAVGSTFYGVGYDNSNFDYIVYSINMDGTDFQVLHAFSASQGSYVTGGLTLVGSALFGLAEFGGTDNLGTIFSLNLDGSDFQVLHAFSGGADGAAPVGRLVAIGDTLYGVTQRNALYSDQGTIFAINTDGTGYQVLYTFSEEDGDTPYAGLTAQGTTLYGTTVNGGYPGYGGAVFSIQDDGSDYQILHSFSGDDGEEPSSSLTLVGSTIYGTTTFGGFDDDGTVFSMNTDGSGFETLHSFDASVDGSASYTGLALAGSVLIGTTYYEGVGGNGSLFSITLPNSSPPPPAVLEVAVSGSAWDLSYLDYLDSIGLGNSSVADLGFALGSTGNATDTLSWLNVDTINVLFSKDVNVTQNSLTLLGSADLGLPSLPNINGFSYDSSTHVATWTFGAPLQYNRDLVNLAADSVTDKLGDELDGTNSGTAGSDYNQEFFILPGDTANQQTVTPTEARALVASAGLSTADAGYNYRQDVDGRGTIVVTEAREIVPLSGTAVDSLDDPVASPQQQATDDEQIAVLSAVQEVTPALVLDSATDMPVSLSAPAMTNEAPEPSATDVPGPVASNMATAAAWTVSLRSPTPNSLPEKGFGSVVSPNAPATSPVASSLQTSATAVQHWLPGRARLVDIAISAWDERSRESANEVAEVAANYWHHHPVGLYSLNSHS